MEARIQNYKQYNSNFVNQLYSLSIYLSIYNQHHHCHLSVLYLSIYLEDLCLKKNRKLINMLTIITLEDWHHGVFHFLHVSVFNKFLTVSMCYFICERNYEEFLLQKQANPHHCFEMQIPPDNTIFLPSFSLFFKCSAHPLAHQFF